MQDRTEQSLLLGAASDCCAAAVALLEATGRVIAPLCSADADEGVPDAHQIEAHGYAWMATYVRALQQMLAGALALDGEERFGELEYLILRVVFSEYLSQLADGIPMNQTEFVRPAAIGTPLEAIDRYRRAVSPLTGRPDGADPRLRIAEIAPDHLAAGSFGDPGLDETHSIIRDTFRRFADDEVQPFAQQWHRDDVLIPMTVVSRMAEMGAFGLSIPEEYGGSGLGKLAMAVMSEELSRGYIGVGSLGTRSEIAAELIRLGGTDEQKERYLPRIARGEILPTAVFTEPDTGSDLGSLSTRAVRTETGYAITGAKTWITHASRSDLMTVLVRTGPASHGYRSLSMFLAEKLRGTDDDPFPTAGMTGGEIKVLGYRGMKEYELAFDGFEVPHEALLGEVEGNGFKQLMATFESARVQTAARAVGVAQNALELGLGYALERIQFGKAIIAFPRVAAKVGWMVAETMAARQLTYFAAREKDEERRSDVEAGMAKLLAARVAWANADNALQIHGGNGYAEEYPISRVLCDARILNIFEGAAEIQAQVIAQRLLAAIEPA